MLEWLGIIFQLLKSTPEILGVLFELKKMFDDYLDNAAKQEAAKQLGAALSEARTTKDTAKLTALVNSIVTTGKLPDNKPAA